ncbi:MAG TPA: hypothetical protein VF849_00105 [Blattabacteriaceae bacterium]
MKIYQVFDNNKPAQFPFHKVHPSWKRSKFNSFIKAFNYAKHWLGVYKNSVQLKLNTPSDYTGYGDLIEIRRIS